MRLIDLTHPLMHGQQTFPTDPKLSIIAHGTVAILKFFDDFPSLTQDAAHYLIARRIRLLGMDTPTPSRDWLEVHRILLGRPAEVVVVESLAHLDQLPDQFTFIGFPLLFTGRDGSPIRAVGLSE